jgi:hypothetical protein
MTHLRESGEAHMVDVSAKPESERIAIAQGQVRMGKATLRMICEGRLPKGDVLAAAREDCPPSLLEALAQDAPAGLADDLLETKRLAGQAMEELLALARQLRPAALDDHGLVPALEGQVRRFREQEAIR